MKKLVAILLMIMILSISLTTVTAHADTVDFGVPPVFGNQRNSIQTLVDENDSIIGIALSGRYFAVDEMSKLLFRTWIYDAELGKNFAEAHNNGTTYDKAEEIDQKVYDVVNYIDSIANTQYEGSDIYKFNQLSHGQSVAISDTTADIITLCKEMYTQTGGKYNPASYRLVDLWGFSSRTYYKNGNLDYDRDWTRVDSTGSYYYPLPDNRYIEAFMQLSDFDSVQLGGTVGNYTLTKNCPDVTVLGKTYSQWIDLGGMAKGYAVDLVEQLLQDNGYNYYFVDSASSSMLLSSRQDGSSLTMGIRDPQNPWQNYASLDILQSGVSTSGLYERYYNIGDKRYSHIIDSSTGHPVDNSVESVTVVGGSAAVNDCLTTALVVGGRDYIIQYVNSQHCIDNNHSVVALQKDSQSAVGYSTVTNIARSQFVSYNDQYPIVTKIFVNSDGTKTIVLTDTPVDGTVWLYVILSVIAVAIMAVVIYRRVHYPKKALDNVDSIREGKLFKKSDIIVYCSLLAVIVVLFVVFVFTANSQPYTTVDITSTISNQIIVHIDRATREITIAQELPEGIVIQQSTADNNIIITITQGERYNVITIYSDGTVKVTDSICGLHRECVNNFPAINNVGDAIICSPNAISIVGK